MIDYDIWILVGRLVIITLVCLVAILFVIERGKR